MKKSIIIAFSLFCGSDQIIMPAWSRPDILLKRYKMHWLTKDIDEALSLAVENNDPLAVKIALDEGADINKIADSLMDAPLSIAANQGNEQIVQMLLGRGANLEIKSLSWNGSTPLYHAIYNRHKNIAEMFIKAGADINAQDYDGRTPLMLFLYEFMGQDNKDLWKDNSTDMMNWLINAGAKLDVKDTGGSTALMFAVMQGYEKAVSELVKQGADIFIKNDEGWTVLDYALFHKRKEIAKILIDAGLTDIAPSFFKRFNTASNFEKLKKILSWFDPLIEEVNAKNKAKLLRTLDNKFPRDMILNEFWPSLCILTGSEQLEQFEKEKLKKLKKLQRIGRAAQSRNATKRALLQQIDSQSSMYKDEKEKREFIEFKEEVELNMLQDEMRKSMPKAV